MGDAKDEAGIGTRYDNHGEKPYIRRGASVSDGSTKMNLKVRLPAAVGMGALLGVFCIIGVGSRLGFEGNEMFLFAMWFNRVVMGLLIGFAGGLVIVRGPANWVVRGLLLGLVVTSAFAFTSEFRDLPGFFAGIAYGPIIDVVASRLEVRKGRTGGKG